MLAQANIQYENQTASKTISKREAGLSWLQPEYSFPVTADTQWHDSEHVIQTGNRDHIGIVIEPYNAIAKFC